MYHAKPEQIANRAAETKRKTMEKEVGKAALKGKDVDHKRPSLKAVQTHAPTRLTQI